MPNQFIQIGVVQKPTGLSGDLRVEIDDHFSNEFLKSTYFFVKINGHYVPYFVEYAKETNAQIIKFEDINSPEQGAKFSLKDLYLRQIDIVSKTYKNEKEREALVGYSLFHHAKLIGIIDEIILFPQQIMANINVGNKSILVPVVDDWIINIDHDRLQIVMNLPDGLLEI